MSILRSRLRLSLLSAAALSLAVVATVDANGLRALKPGEFVVHRQTVPIDLVFIGYEQNQIDEQAILEILPAIYRPLVRFPQFYGLSGRDMGLEHRFRYRFVYKSALFENHFFAFLKRTGVAGPPTAFQEMYNDEQNNVLDVTGPVLYIDAPSVERYLAGPRGDDQKGYTIFFINWYGRKDFKFHVYTKTDEPDPDTKYNFGVLRSSRQIIAWGGTSSRTWFYDLSAGPEAWTNNWSVDDDQTQYHMPPIWEYLAGVYRPTAQLSQDLGFVTRFVGIDLLFTTSPLYDPLVTAPDVGGAKVAHVAMLEDDPDSRGLKWIDARFTKRELTRFQPYYPWKVGLTDTKPIDAGAKRTLDIFSENLHEDDCWNFFGDTFAQMFCYFTANLDRYVPEYRSRDYVGEIFAYNTTGASLGVQFGLLGFADDNWVDGTQTHVFMFDTPEYRELGFGFTATAVHEFGHHVGMSHPHDGYDSELDIDFGPAGLFEFAWSGDESHTVMQYLALTNQFGRFDKDNSNRWEMAGYLNWSNAVAGDILAHPQADRPRLLLWFADAAAAEALEAFNKWEYLKAAASARLAYALVITAARQIGADTTTLNAARRALPNSHFPRDGCRIRYMYQ
jgi:hypothetical protein